jgi:hypothetical protein
MANCFEIEKQIKKRKLRKSWYMGERIVKKTGEHPPAALSKSTFCLTVSRREYFYFDEKPCS